MRLRQKRLLTGEVSAPLAVHAMTTAGSRSYALSIRLSDSSTFSVALEADPTVFTVADLKKAVQAAEAAAAASGGGGSGVAAGGTAPDLQKLVYKGRILKDADTLEQYGE